MIVAGRRSAPASGSVLSGVADPTTPPDGAAAVYYRTDTAELWLWDGSAWQKILSNA